jgi:formate hydrogenlyase subunit 3/multisubunit Na+/H+ antiporter MnhD subunit
MQTLGKIAATLGVIGAIAVGSVVPAAAWYGYGYHHRYYGYHHRYHHRYYAYYRTIATTLTGAGGAVTDPEL